MIAKNSHNPSLPCIIDLFSGCGGMSLGFSNAGFPVLASVDINKAAVKTVEYNLAHRSGISDFGHKGITGDIRELSTEDILSEGFDSQLIVIGGPPCQAYSMAGRGKLRSLGEHRAYTKDERGNFYIDFLNFAISAKACAVVMENVPAAVSYGEKNVPDDACNLLEKNGYHAKWTILNAADFGVPQRRERLFLIATRKDSKMNPAFPRASHKCPKGQITQTGRMLKGLQERSNHFVLPAPNKSKKHWVTVGEALSDLPILFPSSEDSYYLPKPSEAKNYSSPPTNSYQKIMRGSKTMCCGHGFRKTLRDFPVFEKMSEGDDYRHAVEIAESLLSEKLSAARINEKNDPARYQLLRDQTVPPYRIDQFIDKWKKLSPSAISHTLPAHLGTDTYSHIHYREPRGISVREAARLQSFPDDFLFPCSMTDAFKQIGNAVPPLLAEAIANSLKSAILKENE